ncbi:collagen alpha-4(VI) chain-like [Hippocampus comes]|uniref:collagen alpha-4(VI) chain-like n=1 Tax=Hippocampus comes TaxID=109280 RepID=UPI00094E699F|nr:PREDICTED: collagen alpha-4(VI) chain-like [Hippocampus comes]
MDRFLCFFFLLASVALINGQVIPDIIAISQGDVIPEIIAHSQGTSASSQVTTASSLDTTASTQVTGSTVTGTDACVDAKVADVVFLVDSSGSIGSTNFQEVREFLQTVVSGLDIGPDNVRVGLAQYNQDPVLEFSLLEHMDKNSLLAELGNLPYLEGGTQTGEAIDFIRTQLFNENAGSRASQGVPQIAVVITDGVSGDDVVQPALRLREHGVTVFAIGVGGAIVNELDAIANQPSENFRFLIDSFQSLQSVSEVVLENICNAINNKFSIPGPPAACVNATVADVVFLVDSSGSIGSVNFQEVREFLQTVVSGFDIGPDNVRVGLAQYNQNPVLEFSLMEHLDKDSLLAELGNLPYLGGGTQTGRAIDFIRTQLFNESAGSRASQGVPQIAVVITDGASGDDVVQPALRLREHGVTVFAIGVGGANVIELEAIANQPSDDFRFLIDNFQSLQSLSEVVLETICESISNPTQVPGPPACVNATEADVVFLVDSSGSIGSANFQEVREFLQNVVSGLDIGPDNVRVGLAQYNQDPVLEFSLMEHMDKNSLLAELDNLPYLGGDTQTGEAIDFIRTQLFNESAGSRASQGVPQIAVVITDGASGDGVVQPALRLRDHGVTVFAIGVGGGANVNELEAIANQPSDDFRFLIDSFQSLQNVSEVVLENICDAITDQLRACVDATVADVVFLVDSSGSIGSTDFQEVRRFLRTVVSEFDIGPDNVRVGLAQCNQDPFLEFSLLEHTNKDSLLAELDNLPFRGGCTETGEAIDFIRTQLFNENAGSRASQGVAQIAVVITDGVSGDDVVQPALRLRQHGVTVFAIGVGGANVNELDAIANQPSENFRFLIDSFQSLQSVSEVVLENICNAITDQFSIPGPPACVDATVADVVFLVDSSGSIGSTDFQEVRRFLRTVVSGLNIGPDNVRVGLAQYNQDPVLEFSLLEHTNKDSLLAELGNLPFRGGSTDTGEALDFIRTQLFNESAGSRAKQGVPQIAVVITDGVSTDDVVQPALRLRQHEVTVFAIGVGLVNVTELDAIANQPSEDFRFLIDNFQSLQNVSEVVLENICESINDQLPDDDSTDTTASSQDTTTSSRDDGITDTTVSSQDTTASSPDDGVTDTTVSSQGDDSTATTASSQACVNATVADVVFLVDSSGSIGSTDFQEVRRFLRTVVSEFDIGPDNVRVGLAQCNQDPFLEFSLMEHLDKDSLLAELDNLPFRGGCTETGEAIDFIRTQLFNESAGSRASQGVSQIAVVITDGVSGDDVVQPALRLRQHSVTVFAIGVGGGANVTELDAIANQPSEDFRFLIDNFQSLQSVSEVVLENICESITNHIQACVNATVADVVFLVDGSRSIGSANFQEVREFLRTVVSGFDIGPDNIRVALVQYSTNPFLEFLLLEHMDKNSLLVELDNLPYRLGGTQTGEAIDFIRTQLFNENAGSRASKGVPQIAVVITDGDSQDDVVQPALRLREHGVTVFAIGVGGANVIELEAIANQPSEDFRFLINNFQSLQRLREVVLETICESITNPIPVTGPPDDEDDLMIQGRVYLHIKAQVNFTLGVNVTEILQQFIINATREFCDDCQLDFNSTTVTLDQSP